MAGLDWLTARPIAHRGLHGAGAIENTASAFAAAIAGGYGIECDLQISADGEAMVHHDDALGRLTEGQGRLADLNAAALKAIRFKASDDRMLTLNELCELVAGRATLVLELKSRFDGDHRLVAAHGQGPRRLFRACGGNVVRSGRDRGAARHRARLDARDRRRAALRSSRMGRGDVTAKVHTGALAARIAHAAKFHRLRREGLTRGRADYGANFVRFAAFGVDVRSGEDLKRARRYADQIIFEGFRP